MTAGSVAEQDVQFGRITDRHVGDRGCRLDNGGYASGHSQARGSSAAMAKPHQPDNLSSLRRAIAGRVTVAVTKTA